MLRILARWPGSGRHRVDQQGQITWLDYVPSFAEIAVAEGRDYRAAVGDRARGLVHCARKPWPEATLARKPRRRSTKS